MVSKVFKAGNTALITGGASGIGLALAKKCHSYGMRVAIIDINKEHLDLAKKSVGERTSIFAVDVSKLDEWARLKEKIDDEFGGKINLLALNAGIGPRGSWTDVPYFHTIFDTNVFGVINGVGTFLSSMQASATLKEPAAIVITGSKQGITNPPGNCAYNASKAAVRSLAEHLSWDLRATGNAATTTTTSTAAATINVHLLVPGWTYTGLSGGAPGSTEGKPAGAWSAEQVVDFLEAKMAEGKFYVICPDNDVDEETDRRRMMWGVGDLVQGRPPLTRWREEWKAKAEEGMKRMELKNVLTSLGIHRSGRNSCNLPPP